MKPGSRILIVDDNDDFRIMLATAHPIVMVTGYAQFYSAAEILSAGIDAFLQKPISIDKLLDVIHRI